MIPVALTGLLGKLAPILKVLGIDPAKMANSFGRHQVEGLFRAQVAGVALRLEEDGLTPAVKGETPEAERQMVRSAMYLLAKGVFATKLPKGANVAADQLRDLHDDKIVARVSPQIDHTTTTTAMVELVAREWVDLLF